LPMSMLCSTHGRVHVCPIKALEAVSAEARAWLPERFRPHFLSGGAFKLGTEAQTSARLLAVFCVRSMCSGRWQEAPLRRGERKISCLERDYQNGAGAPTAAKQAALGRDTPALP
jgi:hypothetical protein